ncbi:hypothetical protein KQ298_08810 [Synechococcus sp. CS-1330]|nr:hypothetical protein [Synechococcus sp. CS-1330]
MGILGLAVVAGVGLMITAAVLGSIDELPMLGRLLQLVGLVTGLGGLYKECGHSGRFFILAFAALLVANEKFSKRRQSSRVGKLHKIRISDSDCHDIRLADLGRHGAKVTKMRGHAPPAMKDSGSPSIEGMSHASNMRYFAV